MFGVDLRFSSAFCCIGFAACSAESWNRNFFACFFNLFVCFFAFCFCKFAISKQAPLGKLEKYQKHQEICKKNAKNMQNKCNTNCKKDATQAKKTLKLETKTLFLHVFVSDISLFFLGLSRVSLGFSRFLIPSKEALGIF